MPLSVVSNITVTPIHKTAVIKSIVKTIRFSSYS